MEMTLAKVELAWSSRGAAGVDYPATTRRVKECGAIFDWCRFILISMERSDNFKIRLRSCQIKKKVRVSTSEFLPVLAALRFYLKRSDDHSV